MRNSERITHYMRSEGTDPQLSNDLADVVIEVWKDYFGENDYVPLSIRFSIAHELQRRFDISLKEKTDDRS